MDLKLKFKLVALATKYKNQLDFSYINNGIKEYCSYNLYVRTPLNIGALDEELKNFKHKMVALIDDDNFKDKLSSPKMFDICLYPFCKLLGLNYSVVVKIMEKYFISMHDFLLDAVSMDCDYSYAFQCCVMYLNYIEIPKKYLKEYLDYVNG